MSGFMALLLVIRVFDRSNERAEERLTALTSAAAVFRHAEIDTHWVDCSPGSPDRTLPTCTTPLAPGELTLRITDGPLGESDPRRRTLGYSLVEPETGGGTLATVFSDRITWLARKSKTSRTTLLGRAIAHEIGHLVIGTSQHSATGLMRATWTAEDLSRNRSQDWLFTPIDRSRLHNARVSDVDPIRFAASADDIDDDES